MGIAVHRGGRTYESFYQDLWIKGAALEVGKRGCKERYEAIETYLATINHPIRVLDFGANMGYFSFRLAERFFGTFAMVEYSKTSISKLSKLCQLNANPQVVFFACGLDLAGLEALLMRERFDVVLILSVIHHFSEPFNDIVKTLTRHVGHVILEHASPNETHCPNADRVKAEPLDLSPYDPVKLISTPATGYRSVFRDTWALKGAGHPEPGPEGIHLSSYVQFKGVYPHPQKVIDQLKKAPIDKVKTSRLVKGKIKNH